MRVEERRIVGADDDVCLVEPVERAACDHAVYRADQWLPDLVLLGSERSPGVVAAPDVARLVEAARLAVPRGDVDTGAERPVARRAQDHDVDVVLAPDSLPDGAE